MRWDYMKGRRNEKSHAWQSLLTTLRGLSHDVTNVVAGASTKDATQALSTLKTSRAQSISIIRLLAMADKVNSWVCNRNSGSSQNAKSNSLNHDEDGSVIKGKCLESDWLGFYCWRLPLLTPDLCCIYSWSSAIILCSIDLDATFQASSKADADYSEMNVTTHLSDRHVMGG